MSNRTKAIISFTVALLAIGGLYAGMQPPKAITAGERGTEAPQPLATQLSDAVQNGNSPVIDRFRVTIENAKPGVAVPVLKATQGDSLTIDITSDRSGTLEIHGYGKTVAVTPGSESSVSFVATRAGRFPIDLHARDGRHLEVTALEVLPR
jgi:FtsP/CotA-like multicopper oxidase with cupredoxin domain